MARSASVDLLRFLNYHLAIINLFRRLAVPFTTTFQVKNGALLANHDRGYDRELFTGVTIEERLEKLHPVI